MGTKIILPQNEEIRRALEDKLAEYMGRLEIIRANNPGISSSRINRMTSTGYKAAIAQRLLETGEVDAEEFLAELRGREEGTVDLDNYDNAIFVIGDYCENQGENVYSGTGFPVGRKREFWEERRERIDKQFSKKI